MSCFITVELHFFRRLLTQVGSVLLAVCLLDACRDKASLSPEKPPAGVVPVKVARTDQGYQLMRGGKPYFIKGGAGLHHYDQLRAAGANSVRLWSADYADDRMNEAHRHGLTVLLGLWLEHESKEFDYYDNDQVARQHERLRQQVLRYRQHPALLAWGVGNEINFESANPELYRAINDAARMIHELDPYHPVTISLTSTLENLNRIKRLCPAIDFVSVNAFGNLIDLDQRLRKQLWTGPYLVTEFGTRGYWESKKTTWQAAEEQTSTQKASFTQKRYTNAVLANADRCLGAYVFYWGNKYEYTATWFSLFAPTGEKTETVDMMQKLWTNRLPANQAPQVFALRLANPLPSRDLRLEPGWEYLAEVAASDPENDSLRIEWEVVPEVKQDLTNPMAQFATPTLPVENCVRPAGGLRAVLRTPTQPGPYRLIVNVFDGKGSVGTANAPFYVQPVEASKRP